MIESESRWLLPENFKKMEAGERAQAQACAVNGNIFTSYYLCRQKNDFSYAQSYCLSDQRAAEYVKNLTAFLETRDIHLRGRIIDIGCSVGTITNALDKVNVDGQTAGLDFSEDAIAYAKDRYPGIAWYSQSADDLKNFADNSFDIIHVREFYPLDRTNDADYHLQYLKSFHAKLKPGGALIMDLRNLKRCFSNTYKQLAENLLNVGYLPLVRKQVVRHAFFRMFGEWGYRLTPLNLVLTAITCIVGWLTRIKPNYFYLYVKK